MSGPFERARKLDDYKVREGEAVAGDDFSGTDRDGRGEHRPSVDTGVELAALAAGIGARWKIVQQFGIEFTPGEGRRQLLQIDAGEARAQAAGDHFARELIGGNLPQRKQRLEAGGRKLLDTIGADFFQKEIAKCNRLDLLIDRALAGLSHALLVNLIRTRPRERNRPQGQSDRGRLCFKHRAAHSVHGHAIELGVEGREQTTDLDRRIAPQNVEGPRAVFAAAPGEKNALHSSMIAAALSSASESHLTRCCRSMIAAANAQQKGCSIMSLCVRALIFAVLVASNAAVRGQGVKSIVEQAVHTELAADGADHSRWIYLDVYRKPGSTVTQWVAETRLGDLKRVLDENGHQLSEQQQRARMDAFARNAATQAKQHKSNEHDDQQARQMLSLLPQAFVWTRVKDENGRTVLHFTPNPHFHPPNYEARVFAAMSGEMAVDDAQHRIVSLKGRMIHDVKFLGGILGSLKAGGSFDVERRETGHGVWQITETHVHIEGHALLFKNISDEEDEVKSRFRQIAGDLSFAGAEQQLMAQHE